MFSTQTRLEAHGQQGPRVVSIETHESMSSHGMQEWVTSVSANYSHQPPPLSLSVPLSVPGVCLGMRSGNA